MLDYRIHTFLTLYRQMNYRKTAELLNMTQPGVTQHIQFLEKTYGVRLFAYDGRTLRRTKDAEILKKYMDSMAAEERAMEREFVGEEKTALNVGATKTIGEFVILPTVKAFLADESHSLNLTVDNTQTLLQMLEDARLDFALVEGVFDRTRYASRLYKKERFLGICRAGHPFDGKTVSMEELFRMTLIVREPGSGTRRLLEQAMTDRGYSLHCFSRLISASSFSAITALVAAGDAVTFAYAPVAESSAALSTFEVEELSICGEFRFVYCNAATGERSVRLLFPEE
ncbi:MAG: LysR family transcriptional regulator [Faecousia sp.]